MYQLVLLRDPRPDELETMRAGRPGWAGGGGGFCSTPMNSFLSRNPGGDPRTASVLSRRRFLQNYGAVGGAGPVASADGGSQASVSLGGGLHHRPKAKRVIQLFMNGGASQMDTFDYKPELVRLHGESLGPAEKPEGQTGMPGAVMKSPFEFKQHGQSGRWVSSVSRTWRACVDDMAFLMAMTSKTNVHGPAATCRTPVFCCPGFPCMGAWMCYGLGSLTDNLPTFVVLPDPRGLPYNRKGNFSVGLSARAASGHDHPGGGARRRSPTLFPPDAPTFTTARTPAARAGAAGATEPRTTPRTRPGDSRLEARIASYELAAQMQLSAPEAFDLTRGNRSDEEALRHGPAGHRGLRPALPAGAPSDASAACGSCRSGAGRRARPTIGTTTATSPTELPPIAAAWISPSPRC